jgi:hypothetical protein
VIQATAKQICHRAWLDATEVVALLDDLDNKISALDEDEDVHLAGTVHLTAIQADMQRLRLDLEHKLGPRRKGNDDE